MVAILIGNSQRCDCRNGAARFVCVKSVDIWVSLISFSILIYLNSWCRLLWRQPAANPPLSRNTGHQCSSSFWRRLERKNAELDAPPNLLLQSFTVAPIRQPTSAGWKQRSLKLTYYQRKNYLTRQTRAPMSFLYSAEPGWILSSTDAIPPKFHHRLLMPVCSWET